MIKQLLVGMDDSTGSTTAFQWTCGLASLIGARVTVASGFTPRDAEVTPDHYEELQREAERSLDDEWTAKAREAGLTARTLVRSGDPRESLPRMMNESGADILVVGAHGSGSTPGFLHLGSVVEHLAHHSTLPMAVIPEQSRPVFDTIALGVDGSSNNQAAVDLAADLAAGIGATVLAIAVEEPVVEFSPANSPQNWRRYTEEQVRTTWAKRVEDAGVELEVAAVRDLRPAEGLLRTAKQQRCDVLVVGLRGLGGISGLRAGGVAMQVLHHADRPIVLVPPR